MIEYVFFVQGSEPDPYTVTFAVDGEMLFTRCTCKAGQRESFCKHRVRIIKGQADDIVSRNLNDVAIVHKIATETSLTPLLKDIETVENNIEMLSNVLRKCKSELSARLSEGVEISEQTKSNPNNVNWFKRIIG